MKSCLYLLLLSSLYLSTNVSAFEAKTNKKAEEQRLFSIGINGNAMLRFEN